MSSNLSFFSIVSPRAAGDGDSYHFVFKIPHYASNQIIRQLFKHSLSHTESQKRPTWRWTIQIGAVSYRKSNIPLLKKWKLCIVLRSNGNKNSSVLHNRLSNERADQHREFVASRFQQNHSKDCVKKSSETSWGMNLKLDHTSKSFSNHIRSIMLTRFKTPKCSIWALTPTGNKTNKLSEYFKFWFLTRSFASRF